jgi:NADPH:quinone reductase-like Zn-dependent oxidoreductase
MKAIIWTRYGSPDVLQLKEIAKPTPRDNEVLIKIHAATVTTADCELRSSKVPIGLWLPIRLYLGLTKPRIPILGQELAGEIEAVGKDVTRFKPGDQIFAWTAFRLGAYAEYTCVPEKGVLAIKPSNMTYEEAAPLCVGGLEAAHLMRRGAIQSGEKVLINGAGGSIGTFAIQLAKHFGAEVTGVDSTEKLDVMHSIGADHVIDYTREKFTQNGETYDVIFDVIGKSSFSGCLRSLKRNGRYLLGNPGLSQGIRARWTSMPDGKKVITWGSRAAGEALDDLNFLKGLIEAGKIKSVIDKRYPLEQTAEAHRYVDTGKKKGSVVIIVGGHNMT